MVKPESSPAQAIKLFLYSQEISNGKTQGLYNRRLAEFLYSQEISNGKTRILILLVKMRFLYSQEISNGKTFFELR